VGRIGINVVFLAPVPHIYTDLLLNFAKITDGVSPYGEKYLSRPVSNHNTGFPAGNENYKTSCVLYEDLFAVAIAIIAIVIIASHAEFYQHANDRLLRNAH